MGKKSSIFVLGCRGSGKTGFLSGLAVLSRPSSGSDITLLPADNDSAAYLKELRDFVDQRQWPPFSTSVVPLRYSLKYQGQAYDLNLLDYPGELLARQLEKLDDPEVLRLRAACAEASIILVLLDPTRDLVSRLNNEPGKSAERQDALAAAVGLVIGNRGDGSTPPPDLFLVITKSDCLSPADEEEIIRQNKTLLEKLASYHAAVGTVRYFFLSACAELFANSPPGATEYPVNPNPSGYDKLFEQIKQRSVRETRSKTARFAAAVVMAGLLLLCGYFSVSWALAKREKSAAANAPPNDLPNPLTEEGKKALDQRVRKELERLRQKSAAAASRSDLKELLRAARELAKANSAHQSDIWNFVGELSARIEESYISEVRQLAEPGQRLSLCGEYLKNFPSGKYVDEVKETLREAQRNLLSEEAASIARMRVFDMAGLQVKIDAIASFVGQSDRYGEGLGREQLDQIRAALNIARRLAAARQITLLIKRAGYDGPIGDHPYRVLAFQNMSIDLKEDRDRKAKETVVLETNKSDRSQLHNAAFPLPHKGTYSPYLVAWSDQWNLVIDRPMAHLNFNIFQLLNRADGEHHFDFYPIWQDKNPRFWITATVALDGYTPSKEDLDAYGLWIEPGNKWTYFR